MDPQTLIAVLGLHLATTGVLLFVLARQMPGVEGLERIACGAVVFGAAYGLRLYQGLTASPTGAGVLDSSMVLSSLLLASGLRRLSQRPLLPMPVVALGTAAFAGARFIAEHAIGPPAPLVLLASTLAAVYASIAWTAGRDARDAPPASRPPLAALQGLMAFLSLLTLWRALAALGRTTQQMYLGWPAQAYYAGATLTAVLLGPTLLWLVFARLNSQLVELATHDALTRTLNRKGFDDALRRHFGSRQAQPVTLLQVDVDRFKLINDRHGHHQGDLALRAVADTLVDHVRGGDIVARIGGDEFCVALVGGATPDAQAKAEHLRQACHGISGLGPPGDGLRCTVSIGVSLPFGSLGERHRAERQADAALYAAKEAGRDGVALTARVAAEETVGASAAG